MRRAVFASPRKPTLGVLAAATLLTLSWAILSHQIATPRGLNRSVSAAIESSGGLSTIGPSTSTSSQVDLDFLEREADLLATAFGVRWQGYWFVTDEQAVTIRARASARQARTSAGVRVYLDGKLVVQHDGASRRRVGRGNATLAAGAHQVVVDYHYAGGPHELRVDWAPAGEQYRALPTDNLFVRRLDRGDFAVTRAVDWLGGIALAAWLGIPLVMLTPTIARRLHDLGPRELKRRSRVLAFPALLGPLQIVLFGTHTIYSGNADEFSASLGQIAVHWLLPLTTVVVVLVGLGLFLSARWYRRYAVTLFALGVVTWLQGGVFFANYGAFTGEGVEWDLHAWRTPYELGLWLVVPLAMLASSRWLVEVAPFASQLFVALQVLVLVVSSVRTDVDAPATLSDRPDFIFELSRTQNVIHVVLDAFQSDVFQEIIDTNEALADSLSGFVFFPDNAGAFRTTIASIPAMLTGETYRNQEPIHSFIRDHAATQSLLSVLPSHGFDTDGVSIHGHGLESATNGYQIPKPYVRTDEYTRFAAWQLVDLSLFRHVPHVLKPWVYNEQNWRLQNILGEADTGESTQRRHHAENGRAFLADFIERARVSRDRPVYKFLHVGIPHLPLVLDADCDFIGVNRSSRVGYQDQATCAVTLVARLLDRLRILGVYDESVIILSSDHGANMPPRGFIDDPPLPVGNLRRVAGNARALLAIKGAHATGLLRTSEAPTTLTDIPATVMDLLGIAEHPFSGRSVLGLDVQAIRDRTYAWYEWTDADWRRPYLRRMDLFAISGSMSDRRSWSFTGAIFAPGTSLEAMSRGWGEPRIDARGESTHVLEDRVELYAPPETRSMILEMRSAAPAPRVMQVTVLVNGRVADRVVLDDHAWRTVEYALPAQDATVSARIDLRVDPPARLRPRAERDLGVVARDVQWRP